MTYEDFTVNHERNITLKRPTAKITHIQVFRERLSEKVHPTIPIGIVGGFEFTLLQRNLKEWQERPRTYVCEC